MLLFSGCDTREETETVPVSAEEQQLREQAGLHPGDERPAAVPTTDGGPLGADDPRLRQKAGLKPATGEDHPKTPQQLRERLDIEPDEQPPPKDEAEMRERMKLHPERVEEER